MTCSVILIALLLPIISATADKITCPVGEELKSFVSDCSDYCPKSEKEALTQQQCLGASTSSSDSVTKCTCGFNQRRGENGVCISVHDCPPFDCSSRPNEHYLSCPSYCPGESCKEATPDGKCLIIIGLLPVLTCYPTCHCINLYWRKNGICVPYSECD